MGTSASAQIETAVSDFNFLEYACPRLGINTASSGTTPKVMMLESSPRPDLIVM
jgi:hypothetical protein